jgi:hypothetical protein
MLGIACNNSNVEINYHTEITHANCSLFAANQTCEYYGKGLCELCEEIEGCEAEILAPSPFLTTSTGILLYSFRSIIIIIDL